MCNAVGDGNAERSVWLMNCPLVASKSWQAGPCFRLSPRGQGCPLHSDVLFSPGDMSFVGRVAVEGKVEHKFDMKLHNDNIEEYGNLCYERTNKSMIITRIQDKKKATPVEGSEMKRTRRDHGELEDSMLKPFERQPNWALKQLVQETDQPTQFLKVILNELCVYNKRGTNQRIYELKPE